MNCSNFNYSQDRLSVRSVGVNSLAIEKKERNSNLELYRIICMLMIIAHHFVVNSGLTSADGPITSNPNAPSTLYLLLFGMWGKTGINCFLMITGYFMCKSDITVRKFLKLLLAIYFYKIVIYAIFLVTGIETLSMTYLIKLIMPVWGFNQNFACCFLGFYLTIPFLNILIRNMTQRQHQLLILLLLTMYTFLGSIPGFRVAMNYVTWFGIIYFVASYLRLYPFPMSDNKRLWGLISLSSILLAMGSVILLNAIIQGTGFFFVADANKIFALVVAVSTFMWFKNINIPQSKFINAIGGSTFGVLLIHANSDAMRRWLWKDTVDCVGHYSLPFLQLMLFSIGVVIIIFIVCTIIDRIRIRTIEKYVFTMLDKKLEKLVWRWF